ncbi:MAG: hypothetical protein Greene041679_192 [Parcubacteria group bacterium Greene0416_79]|nr:MAG: hypothetical protein Greene041679_192 [Parcubacteria group bacterium Greene0416_79]
MGDFKKSGGNKHRGGDTFNRGPGGRPSFDGGRPNVRGEDRGERAGGFEGTRREMFKATCAECGKPCEVPFRPSGDRPVYCKDCFQIMRGASASDRGDRGGGRDPSSILRVGSRGPSPHFQRRDVAPRPSYAPPKQGSGEDKRLDDIKIQLATVISKLDKLINILGNTAHSAPRTNAHTVTLHDTLARMKIAPTPKKEMKKPKASVSAKKKPAKKR